MILVSDIKVSSETVSRLCLIGTSMLLLVVAMVWRRYVAERREVQWESERLLEMEVYSRFTLTLSIHGEARHLAEQSKQVCRMVADRSAFRKIALLLCNEEDRLVCVGSCGMDDLSQAALERLSEGWERQVPLPDDELQAEVSAGPRHFSVVLGARTDFDEMPGSGCYKAMIVPLRTRRGQLRGALAVCMDEDLKLTGDRMHQALVPIEILAERLVEGLERGQMMERLRQVERLETVVAGS